MHIQLIDEHKKELNLLAKKPFLTLEEIKKSNFYKVMQTATSLTASYALIDGHKCTIEALVLASKIASLSPNLVVANFNECYDEYKDSLYSMSGITTNHLIEIARNLSKSPSLLHLKFGRNKLYEKCVEVSDILSHSGIRALDFNDNHLGGYGAETARNFAKMKNLVKLNLCGNGLAQEGTLLVAQLTQSDTLEILDLSKNKLEEFTPHVAEMACEIRTLRYIDLGHNIHRDLAHNASPTNFENLSAKDIINEYNKKVQDSLEWRKSVECLKDVSSDLGAMYGTVGNIIETLGEEGHVFNPIQLDY